MHPPPRTIVTRRGANHGLHIVLSIVTCGIWAITGWPIAALIGRRTRTTSYGPPSYYPPPGQQPPYGPPPGQGRPPYYPPHQPPPPGGPYRP